MSGNPFRCFNRECREVREELGRPERMAPARSVNHTSAFGERVDMREKVLNGKRRARWKCPPRGEINQVRSTAETMKIHHVDRASIVKEVARRVEVSSLVGGDRQSGKVVTFLGNRMGLHDRNRGVAREGELTVVQGVR